IDQLMVTMDESFDPGTEPLVESESLGGGAVENVPPFVLLSEPGTGSSHLTGASIPLQATAGDSDGEVVAVTFFVDGEEICRAEEAPFACSWPAVAPGSFAFSAVATDDEGEAVQSEEVVVLVQDPPSEGGTGAFLFLDGLLTMEAEHFETEIPRSERQWVPVESPAGFAGEGAMLLDGVGLTITENVETVSPELQFSFIADETGEHFFWIRAHADSLSHDSLFFGINGMVTRKMSVGSDGQWGWHQRPLTINQTGLNTLSLWMREDGLTVDRIIVSRDPDYEPGGQGPPESPRDLKPEPEPEPDPFEVWRTAQFPEDADEGMLAWSADPDGDGKTNLQEYAFGSDPLDSSSVGPELEWVVGSTLGFRFPVSEKAEDVVVEVEASEDLSRWVLLDHSAEAASSTEGLRWTEVSLPRERRDRYFRLRVRLVVEEPGS
ncbi:MAG: Ig-like domain-containing protein, partial [Verrucomicrobiota bacterium]